MKGSDCVVPKGLQETFRLRRHLIVVNEPNVAIITKVTKYLKFAVIIVIIHHRTVLAPQMDKCLFGLLIDEHVSKLIIASISAKMK